MRSRPLGAALGAVLALGLVACGGGASGPGSVDASRPGKGRPAVTLGAKDSTEQRLLGELYAQALRAKGYSVELRPALADTKAADRALRSGAIDVYPEYTGAIVTELAGIERPPDSEQATYEAAARYERRRGHTLLERTPFFDADGLAVLPVFAQTHGLRTIADLERVGAVRYGAPPQYRTRFGGLKGLRDAYGLRRVRFVPLASGRQYAAIDAGRIDVAAIFTTDARLAGGRYTVLEDTQGIFGFQSVAPVVSGKTLVAEGPQFARTLDAVSAKLTTDAVRSMNAAVDTGGKDPADVAEAFLEANGLGAAPAGS